MTLTHRFAEAVTYALELHREQRRKISGVPYAAHLLGAAANVLEYGGSEDEAIAALLHDAIEDQGGTAARRAIAERFGEPIAAIVHGCSDADGSPKPPWQERKEQYIAHLSTASPSIRLVCAADKLHNIRSLAADHRRLGDALWPHFRGGRDGTLWYYRAIVDTLLSVDSRPIVHELAHAVTQFEMAVSSPA
ncbi:MAG: HD domain-containing protein [Patescibacteria group bacterium]|nr:HD domain-containing protein [Patescibacteria group bacterium]